MRILIICLLVLGFCGVYYSAQKWNPVTGEFETTTHNAELKHNPNDDTWSYQPKGSKKVFSPHSGKFEYIPPETDYKETNNKK